MFDAENESADDDADDDEHDPWSLPPANDVYEDEEGDDSYGDNWVVSSARLDSEWESFWVDLHGESSGRSGRGEGGGGRGGGIPEVWGGPGGAGVGAWGEDSDVVADGWTYERLLELDEAVVKKGGMPVARVRALPRVEFNPAEAAREAGAAPEEDKARAGSDATAGSGGEKGKGGEDEVDDARVTALAVTVTAAGATAAEHEPLHRETLTSPPPPDALGTDRPPPPPPYRHAGSPGEDCTVCLMDFVVGDALTRLPGCGHLFHPLCLLPWLKAHRHCPKCRAPLCREDECMRRSEEEEEEREDEPQEVGSLLAGASIAIFATEQMR